MLYFLNEPDKLPASFFTDKNKVVRSSLFRFQSQLTSRAVSVKYVLNQREDYVVDRKRYRVAPGQFLLVNPGQEVEVNIRSDRPVEGLCFYLDPKYLREVQAALLDPSFVESTPEELPDVSLPSGTYAHHLPELQACLKKMVASMERREDSSEEVLYFVAEQFCKTFLRQQQEMMRIETVKHSTREELYKRVNTARNYIHDNLGNPLDLEVLAGVACLSKFHFLRLFKQVYQKTPRQYIIDLRLQRAENLLKGSSFSVQEVCTKIGLQDMSSFGRLFRKRYQISPSNYRKAHRASFV
ncbi:MAG: AraC family transcriptional regulator [Bacteroidota bacterium]